MPTSTAGKFKSRNDDAHERGFTYVMVLAAVVIVGVLAGVANVATSRIVQAEREQELLFRGMAYRNAIQRYFAVAGRYPRSLRDLLKDSRFVQRPYLRALYPDPMADGDVRRRDENAGWQLVRAPDGGVAGVASGSRLEPMKKKDFPPGLENLEDAKRYTEWIFAFTPRSAAQTVKRY